MKSIIRSAGVIIGMLSLGCILWWTFSVHHRQLVGNDINDRRNLETTSERVSAGSPVITGSVCAKSDGQPIAGARIKLVRHAEHGSREWIGPLDLTDDAGERITEFETVSDSDGSFRFLEVPEDWYTVYAQSGSLAAVGFTAAGDRRLILQLLSADVVSGFVKNQAGDPINGARVAAVPIEGNFAFPWPWQFNELILEDHGFLLFWVTADAQGHFSLPPLPGEKWQLIGKATGYAILQSGPVTMGDQNIELRLKLGSTARISVAHEGSGQPAIGVRVRLDGISLPGNWWCGLTDESGQFAFSGLGDDEYVLLVTDTRYVVKDRYPHVTVKNGAAPDRISLSLAPAHTVVGCARDADSGALINGGRILGLSSAGYRHALTDSGGEYRLAGLSDGDVTIKLNRVPGYISTNGFAYTTRIQIPPDQDQAQVDIAIKRGLSIRGTVVDTSNAPIVDAQVDCDNDQTFSGKDGTFEIAGVKPNSQAHVGVMKEGYLSPSKDTVDVKDVDMDGLTIRMEKGGTISGVVCNAEGQTLADVVVQPVTARDSLGENSAISAHDGTFSIVGLRPDSYWLEMEGAENAITLAPPIPVAKGETVSGVRLTYRPASPMAKPSSAKPPSDAGQIAGLVQSEGKPVPKARVQVFSGRPDRYPTVVTGSEGRYSFAGLPPGKLRVGASRTAYEDATVQSQYRTVQLGNGETVTLDFDLSPGDGTVQGRITTDGPPPRDLFVALVAIVSPLAETHLRNGWNLTRTGEFQFQKVPEGVATLVINYARPNFDREKNSRSLSLGPEDATEARIMAVTVTNGLATTVSMDLSKNVKVCGRVSGLAKGERAEVSIVRGEFDMEELCIPVSMRRANAFVATTLSQLDGTFEIPGIDPGPYTVAVIAQPLGRHPRTTRQEISVEPVNNKRLSLALP